MNSSTNNLLPDDAWVLFNKTDSKKMIHLSPANGIPLASYAHFCQFFAEHYSMQGMDNRLFWADSDLPKKSFNWHKHADDLTQAIESRYSQPMIGMGHSLGGTVTVMAAAKRPDLFEKLIIIDGAII